MTTFDQIVTALARKGLRPACSWEQAESIVLTIDGEEHTVRATRDVSEFYLAQFSGAGR